MEDLKQRTLRGGFAKTASQILTFVLRIGSMIVLARLLDPADFGLVAMVTVFTGAFGLLKDAGLSIVTIQQSSISEKQVSALFWVNILVGVTLTLLSVAIAPVLAAFYREPQLLSICATLGIGFLFNAAGVQHSAFLQRQVRFIALAAIETLSWVISVGVGIGLATAGFGPWALVWMSVTLPAVSTVGFWLVTGWIPSMPSRTGGIRAMVRAGGLITLNLSIVYVAYNIDKLLIGRFWGAEALGIYARAYQLINIPTENLNGAMGGIVVSVLARLQGDATRFKNYFLKSYSLVLSITLPVTMACALFADDIIVVLLGRKWTDAVPVFRLMAPTILAFALLNPLGWLLFASGRVRRSLFMAMVIAPLVIIGYAAGLPYGPSGVAIGYSVAMAGMSLPMMAWATHRTGITFSNVIQVTSRPFLAASIAAVLSFVGIASVYNGLSPLTRLLLGGTILVASYSVLLLYVMGQKVFYRDLLRDLRQAMASTRHVPARTGPLG